jgi:hypothetical protein
MTRTLLSALKNWVRDYTRAVMRDEESIVPCVEKLARFVTLGQACEAVVEGLLQELGEAAWAKAEQTIAFHFQRVAGTALSSQFGMELFRAIAEGVVAEMLVPLEDFFAYHAPTHTGPLKSDFQRRVEEPPQPTGGE